MILSEYQFVKKGALPESHAERLDKASAAFFFMGFVVSKLRHTPFVVLAALSNLGSLFLYTIAYGLWFLASQLYPEYPRKTQSWYGFTEFKNQHKLAIVLGVTAVVCCLAAIAVPLAIVPATWLFAFSNCVWYISEYHKKQNPPTSDKDYSTSLQTAYVRYALTTTAMSFLTALDTTIIIFFPPATFLTLTLSTIAGASLGIVALYHLIDYSCNTHKPDNPNASYIAMTDFLEVDLEGRPQVQLPPLDRTPNHPPIFAEHTVTSEPPVLHTTSGNPSVNVFSNS